jgi:hypothetical protein
MLLSALFVGLLTAYYFGLRPAYWAAAATFVLCLVALIVPSVATPLYIGLAVGAIAIQQIGSRRQRPADAVFLTGMAKRGLGRLVRKLTGRRDDE